jgi:la-related protein 1
MSRLFNFCSDENLCKDIYLRQHMDDQGWVPVTLIAGFNQVSLQVLHVCLISSLIRNFLTEKYKILY